MPLPSYIPPQQGQGAFGLVPGNIPMPSPAADLASAYPNLTGTNQAVSGAILGQLGGNISPGTLKALQNAAATFGVGSGMPGSGLQWNNLFGNIAGFAEGQVQKGLQNYGSIIPTVSRTQTLDPALQAEIAAQNALNTAAPNPQAAQSYARGLFNQYLAGLRGPAPASQAPAAAPPPVISSGFAPADQVYNATGAQIGSTVLPPSARGGTAADYQPGIEPLLGQPQLADMSNIDPNAIANMSDEELTAYITGEA